MSSRKNYTPAPTAVKLLKKVKGVGKSTRVKIPVVLPESGGVLILTVHVSDETCRLVNIWMPAPTVEEFHDELLEDDDGFAGYFHDQGYESLIPAISRLLEHHGLHVTDQIEGYNSLIQIQSDHPMINIVIPKPLLLEREKIPSYKIIFKAPLETFVEEECEEED
jgi:hypothetical protein